MVPVLQLAPLALLHRSVCLKSIMYAVPLFRCLSVSPAAEACFFPGGQQTDLRPVLLWDPVTKSLSFAP